MNRILLPSTIFLGSFIAFALEPMIGRTLLPVFGGTPSVWVTCLAAFQVLMVGGYFYAGKVKTCRFHVPLLVVAAIWCVVVAVFRRPLLGFLSGLPVVPVVDVLICVMALAGAAFILLSANSSIVQVLSGGDYRLYAVSNAGSLIGLLAYPVVFEPNLGLTVQWYCLGAGMVMYAVMLFKASRLKAPTGVKKASVVPSTCRAAGQTPTIGLLRRLQYLLIPAITCALLNATTSHLTLDVAPMPLLWAILLGLFLISYIIGFSGRSKPAPWAVLAVVFAGLAAYFDKPNSAGADYMVQLIVDSALVFAGSTFLHSHLYSIRPGEGDLAKYYLVNVIGGAIGGVLTSVVAPIAFSTVAEFPIMVVLTAASVLAFAIAAFRVRSMAFGGVLALLAAAAFAAVGLRSFGVDMRGRKVVHEARGFFGTVQVMEAKARTSSGAEGVIHEFIHGNTVHGIQVRVPGKWRMPTCYYTPNASGYAIVGHPKYRTGEPMRVNITGLGVGVLFSYGRTNDYYRAYEISKDAFDVAMNTNLFSFVADCPSRKEIVLEDARKGLEAELAAGVEQYDVIVVDAFTGDNLPYHLSSKEAFELYFKLLKPDGILCVNISNWHMRLEPYVKKIGEVFDSPMLGFYSRNDLEHLGFATSVVFFCRNPKGMAPPPLSGREVEMIDFRGVPPMAELPTDEKGSFISLIRLF